MHLPHKRIRDRAYFIAGRPSGRRRVGDPNTESAIRDAESYLETLPREFYKPLISGGTSVSSDQILQFTWMVDFADEIRAVVVTFYGSGICSVSLPEAPARNQILERISVEDLPSIGLPQLIQHLRSSPEIDEEAVH